MPKTVRAALAAALLALAAPPAAAQGVFVAPNITDAPRPEIRYTGAQANTHAQLRRYGLGWVDVRRLSPGQMAQIHHYVSRDEPQGEIRNRLETIVRGGGLGQRVVDRVTR